MSQNLAVFYEMHSRSTIINLSALHLLNLDTISTFPTLRLFDYDLFRLWQLVNRQDYMHP
jgi:hypothetical protein